MDSPDDEGGKLLAVEEARQANGLDTDALRLPLTTAMVLHPDGDSAVIVMPLATLMYNGNRTRWRVVRVLDKQQYWVIFDYHVPDHEEDDTIPVPPAKRHAEFPGTSLEMSIGILSDLFTLYADLTIYSKAGFRVYDAGRIDGIIQAV